MASRTDTGWREPILRHFTPAIAGAARLTIVADPDQLLTEPGLLSGLRERGFDLIPYADDVAFRYAYESRYRRLWDRGQSTALVVVLRAAHDDIETLPWDLVTQARQDQRLLRVSLGDLFPHLDPTVVAKLPRTDLDALYEAQQRHQPEPSGQNTTRDFILRHVLGVAPELVTTPAELLRVLLRRHVQHRAWPASLDERFLYLVRQAGRFNDWPLDLLLSDREAFLRFLQERWPIFVRSRIRDDRAQTPEPDSGYALSCVGPELLPFDHPDVRGHVIWLFTDGALTPTRSIERAAVQGTWMKVGVGHEAEADAVDRLARLTEVLDGEVPSVQAGHLEWLQFARRWAEWTALRWTVPPAVEQREREALDALQSLVDEAFERWMLDHYAALHNVSHWPRPVMVHQIPHALAHGWGTTSQRLALVVVDGLALSQWIPLREGLRFGPATFRVYEETVFAWVPTLTSVSRQAIFAGEVPFYFGTSIDTTQKEERHWRRFWEDRGLTRDRIAYVKQTTVESDEVFRSRVAAEAGRSAVRALGIVVGRVDQMLHGAVTGAGGLHAQVSHWAHLGHFERLITLLIENHWRVYVTADHGNVEAIGMGKPNAGAIADERGERAHVFPNDLVCRQFHEKFPASILWPQVGLPDHFHALLAARRGAFTPAGARTVAHGGIALEEVVVPFVRIEGAA